MDKAKPATDEQLERFDASFALTKGNLIICVQQSSDPEYLDWTAYDLRDGSEIDGGVYSGYPTPEALALDVIKDLDLQRSYL